jgi:hypothetical protein
LTISDHNLSPDRLEGTHFGRLIGLLTIEKLIVSVSALVSCPFPQTSVRVTGSITNKSANLAGSRGTVAYGRGLERAGVTAQATRTRVAKRDG